MFEVIIRGTCTTPLYTSYAGSVQQFPLLQPPVVQSSKTSILILKSSAVHVCATVIWKDTIKGPVADVPHPAVPVFTNLQPGPKLNPLGYVCCKSHSQLPTEVSPSCS